MPRFKLAVVGSGSVGSTIAYALVLHRLPVDILLYDVDTLRADGEAMDLSDCVLNFNASIRTSTGTEAGQADMIVITAGAKQRPGETRIHLVQRNTNIMKSVIDAMMPLNPNAIILIVANPVEALCEFAQRMSGLPRERVFGSGTYLDSTRLRHEISSFVNIHESSINCFVLGEHGDNQFVGWSAAEIGGAPLLSFEEMKSVDRHKLAKEISQKAYKIIARKGSTYYGIGTAVAALAEAVLYNSRKTFPVSCYSTRNGCYVSHPAIVGEGGVQRILNISLNEEEELKYQMAVNSIHSTISMASEEQC